MRRCKPPAAPLEQTPAVHHAQDANAARLDAVHQPMRVDEGA
jgi:hypothetical protein